MGKEEKANNRIGERREELGNEGREASREKGTVHMHRGWRGERIRVEKVRGEDCICIKNNSRHNHSNHPVTFIMC